MSFVVSLSQLLGLVQQTIDDQFYGQAYWVRCELADVKRYEQKNWCFCRVLEKKGGQVLAESPAVFWQLGYQHIRRFEQATGRPFANGIEINALAMVKFHPKFGFKLEIVEIDLSFSLGQMELARQETLRRLLTECAGDVRQEDAQYITTNNQLPLPRIIQRVALIAANHSDGQRDFLEELKGNAYGYAFRVTGFYTTVQGEQAAAGMVRQLELVAAKAPQFDVAVVVRGGGSQTDLKPFDDFTLAKTIARFPIPVLTGIGHDRNTSIADLMARQHKVPAKVAAAIVDHNLQCDMALATLETRLTQSVGQLITARKNTLVQWMQQVHWALPGRIRKERHQLDKLEKSMRTLVARLLAKRHERLAVSEHRLPQAATGLLLQRRLQLQQYTRLVTQLSPQATLNRGFAIALQKGKIITGIGQADPGAPLETRLADGTIYSNIQNTEAYGSENDI